MNSEEKALEIIRNKKALVLSGGGTLGVAEVSSLIRLSELGLDIKKIKSVSGSSVGSIISTAIACGGSLYYIENKMINLDFKKLNNKSFILCDAIRLLKNFGLYSMSEIRNLVSEVLLDLVGDKDITFKQLFDKTGIHLTITYLSFNYGRTIFADYIYEPDSLVREAVVKSSAIPVFYEAYFNKKDKKHKEIIVDGGVMANFPMEIPHFQGYKHEEIIGLKFISSEDVFVKDKGQPGTEEEWKEGPTNILSYLNDLVQILRDQAMKVHVKENDWKNTVKIDVGNLSSTDFDMTEEDKEWLYKQGQKAAEDYIIDLINLIEKNKY